MSTKDFFQKGAAKVSQPETLESAFDLKGVEVESSEHAQERSTEKSRYIPDVDFISASNFARYGLAEEYYRNSFKRVYQQFPYDGTRAERTQFDNESTYLDRHIFDKVYPRTTGYAIFSQTDVGWGTQDSVTDGNHHLTGGWGTPSSLEYISVRGGPHTSSGGMIGESLSKAFGDPTYRTSPNSNVYDTDIYDTEGVKASERQGTRESNLLFDLSKGVSTEFWLRKGKWITSLTEKEVIFDLWNGEASSSTGYGRLLIYVTGAAGPGNSGGQDPLRVHLASGSNVWEMSFGGSTTTTSSLTNTWKHIALTFVSSSADKDLQAKFYLDGVHQETTASSYVTNFGKVTGSMIGYIGALQTTPSGNYFHGKSLTGTGKLSGSIDEFRYWKTKRTSKDIGRNWFTHVAGGSNDHIANTELGVYYKFNEGITETAATDSVVLDYSGRLTNGNWVGYASGARDTGSAIVSASAAKTEYLDPIIYSHHPQVQLELDRLVASGSAWDEANNSSLYHSFPSFMMDEEEERSDKHLRNLTQIMSSYFDELHLQIESLTKLTSLNYVSASAKPATMASDLLKSKGFLTSEIFSDVNILEYVSNRDEDRNFELELNNIKNQIYQNIYNNLVMINKSKGTEKAFRNLIRCYGVDEELIKINLYSSDITYALKDNYRAATSKKKFINFKTAGHHSASVYQHSASDNTNTTSVTYISGTNRYLANTAEIEVIFPKDVEASYGNQNYNPTLFVTSSIFGCHQAGSIGDHTWNTTALHDYNFELYAVRPVPEESDAYFLLKDRAGNFSMTSSLYGDVYDNQKWNFAVRIKNEKYPIGDFISGTVNTSASIEFLGFNALSDVVVNEFKVTSSVSSSYLTSNRRYYAGAHLLNFSGALSFSSDVRVNSLRHWASYLDDGALYAHARDPENYGSYGPDRSTWLTQLALTGTHVPQLETLALNWDFSAVTSSDAAGTFVVDDVSSGSSALTSRYPGAYGYIVGNQYAGRAVNFPASSTKIVSTEYIPAARQRLPEALGGTDMIRVLAPSDTTYSREPHPDSYYFAFEKSMYQTISEEMLNMFGTIVEFNSLIGSPVNRYREKYKDLGVLRSLFFERVQNVPNIDKYIEYYRWIDASLSEMIQQLIPAAADMSEGILNVVESHILERNKYRSKFPTLKEVAATEGSAKGYAENTYSWRLGHAPLSETAENKNALWWKERAERDKSTFDTPATVDSQRQDLRSLITSKVSSSAPLVSDDNASYQTSEYAARSLTSLYGISADIAPAVVPGVDDVYNRNKNYYKGAGSFGTSTGLEITDVQSEKDISDMIDTPLELVKKKKRFTVTGENDESLAPFSMYSSSVPDGYVSDLASNFMSSVEITNNHEDVVSVMNEIPMQGPFAEKFVGGSPHRHADINFYSPNKAGKNNLDSAADRIEAYDLDMSTANQLTVMHPDSNRPRSWTYRDETAKRPVNLKNIKQVTGSGSAQTKTVSGTLQSSIGNFSEIYEVVMASDRATNNSSFVKSGGFESASVSSLFIASLNDYVEPTRQRSAHIIVERFSAPGGPETSTPSFLDLESGQYSPYNDMNTRNLTVRRPLRNLLSERSERFGIRSGSSEVSADYQASASFHKTNRNPLKRQEYPAHSSSFGPAVSSSYDNWFIQHHIPRNDTQYAWIAASYTSSYVNGHAEKDGKYSGSAEGIVPAILFASASSDLVSGIKVDHLGMNTLICEPLSSSDARIGYPLGTSVVSYKNTALGTVPTAQTLNSILLHRRGIYGFSSWVTTENHSYNPLVRKWRKENTLTFNTSPGETIVSESGSYEVKQNRFGNLQSFTEPPVTSRNFPLKFILDVNTDQGSKTTEIKSTLGNALDNFTNPSIDEALDATIRDGESYNKIKDLYLYGSLDSTSSPIVGFRSLKYKQNIYPQAQNSFLAKTRSRPGFSNNFWRDKRADRATLGDTKFPLLRTDSGTYSSWNMDAHSDFATALTGTTAGILQNDETHYHEGVRVGVTGMTASILFHRKHDVEASASVKGRTGSPVAQTGAAHTTKALMPMGKVPIGAGNAAWQVGSQAGYYDITGKFVSSPSYPWYDSYEDYASELRALNKDYSIIPEFRISEHIENYIINRGGDFFSDNPSFLSIEGASSSHPQNSSDDDFYKLYSNSDFMKQFDIIREDHRGFVDPSEIRLSCKAIKRFVPYNGFYPSELLADMYTRFSGSYLDEVRYTGPGAMPAQHSARHRPFIAPLFAPGIWCNTIKSGIAVDWAQYTSSYVVKSPLIAAHTPSTYYLIGTSSAGSEAGFYRIPFEAVISPESYMANIPLVDMEPHPSCSLSATASWGGDGDGLYKMKAHNALASMIEFFLPGPDNKGELATLVSSPESEWKPFKSQKVYGMRVKLRRSYNYARPLGRDGFTPPHFEDLDVKSGVEETLTICSRPSSFGPPVCGRSGTYGGGPTVHGQGHLWSGSLDSLNGVNPAYTPPYYDGEAWADLLYLHDGTSQPTLESIQASASLVSWRFDPYILSGSNGGSNHHPYGPNNINNFSMQLTSSINIYGKMRLSTVETDQSGRIVSSATNESQKTMVWAIQPKMEVPILNVKGASASISSPTNGSESIPRSIWSQFGKIPTGSTGLYLEVNEIDRSWLKRRVPLFQLEGASGQTPDRLNGDGESVGNTTVWQKYYSLYGSGEVLSLAEHIGFKKRSAKLGEIAQSRTVKEAVVAIPFLESGGKRSFFEIPKEEINASLLDLEPGGKGVTNSVADMVSKMQDYVFPPKLDFIKNPDISTPFAMYIFEFKHTFDQDDLSYMWQGIQPNSGKKLQTTETSISHKLLAGELMGEANSKTGEPLQSGLRWMVFKVKQKAPTNYYDKVVTHQLSTGESTNTDLSIGRSTVGETDVPEYSYNWPYDYFSLIELVKIESEVKFAPTKESANGPNSLVITSTTGSRPK